MSQLQSDPNDEPLLRSEQTDSSGMQHLRDINQTFKERDIKSQAKNKGMRYIDLKNAPINQQALQLLTWEEVQHYQAVPFEVRGKQLFLACIDPHSESLNPLEKKLNDLGYDIEKFICSPEGLNSIKHYFENFVEREELELSTKTTENENINNWQAVFSEYSEIFSNGTGPEMYNQLNLVAVRFRASDIHFQPQEESVVIRMRRDGALYEVFSLTHKQFVLLSGEIKRRAGMKANVKNIPQDGDYEFIANERKISVRVSSLPSKYGESIVMRLLDAQNAMVELEKLGFSQHNKELIQERLERTKGLLLVTGPTGSGKTSTLYSCLNAVDSSENKIITLEDPIEFELKNAVQSEINEHEGFTFAKGLRAILRQDPDVIMVGEIRDKDAAEIALQASLTGHLVLSTVHANDAISTIPRLLNMGLKPYILAAGLELIAAQRLVRKLCEHCKKPVELDPARQEEIQQVQKRLGSLGQPISGGQVYEAAGCEKCAETGYDGRVAISEVLKISDALRRSILQSEPITTMFQKAIEEGFITLKEEGIKKVLEGVTTFEEIWGVLS